MLPAIPGQARRYRPRVALPPVNTREPVWLFDLDNTLHDCSRHIFTAIDQNMTEAVMDSLQVDANTANYLRKRYWKKYGATVIGMVRHHGIDSEEFLARAHDFDPAPLVHAEAGLAAKFKLLKGRKILLTNAPRNYAQQVLKTLRLLPYFESLWTINDMTLQGRIKPKPSIALMRQVLARVGAPPHRVVLVEDTLRNLKAARQLGMRTVHVFHPGTPFTGLHRGRNDYVDVRLNRVGDLLTQPHALSSLAHRSH